MALTSRRVLLLAAAGVLVAGGGAGGAVVLHHTTSTAAADAGGQASSSPAPPVTPVTLVAASAAADGTQAWDAPMKVTAQGGVLVDVAATGPDDAPVSGTVAGGVWTSTGSLVPSSMYRLTATVRDSAGHQVQRPLVVRTTAPAHTIKAVLNPGDNAVVGVGMPVEVTLDAAAPASARAAVVQRLTVTTTPAVEGAWHWVSPTEVHWRPAEYWAPGTKVVVKADLQGLALPGGVWGSDTHTASYSIGDAVVSTADAAAHTLTVTRNGQVLRVLPTSMGKPGRDTRNGVDLVLEKYPTIVMDSDTVGLPGEYSTKVDWAVRLTYSGTFTHAAPWSVAQQGHSNVSHGCLNLSPANAKWFYDLVRRGDPVQVVNSPVAPLPHDPGSEDWNMSFAEWKAGSAVLQHAVRG